MSDDRPFAGGSVRAFLGALGHDTRANTLAIMAIALIPLAGMVGGGVDISRMYIVKTRLQHACDAGALAGRKSMGGGTWAQTINGTAYFARVQAEKFFDANYNKDAYGVTTVSKSFSENAGKVTGTASADLPMTLMRIFGKTSEKLEVTCDAEMRLPNTDVMFVLDTTGSMDEDDGSGKTKKIDGLKVAVKCFYEIVARLNTSADCTIGTPSGGTGNQVQIRFGFVPYATNVNVGRLLKPEWMADSWDYQTRVLVSGGTTPGPGAWSSWNDYGWVQCSSAPSSSSTTQYQTTSTYPGGWCYLQTRTWDPQGGGTTSTAYWKYGKFSQDVSGLKDGTTGWKSGVSMRVGNKGTWTTLNWDGCIQERKTVKTDNYSPIPKDAYDLDFNLVPSGDSKTKWGPALPGALFTRKSTGSSTSAWDSATINSTSTDYSNSSSYSCPTAARKLQAWNASEFDTYVDSLTPTGNTYHDIGLLWGARLISPTGLFATENAYTTLNNVQGGEIERHIIFMTDGDTNTKATDYNAYGVPWFDKLQTDSTAQADLDNQVDKRFAALCAAITNATFNDKGAYTLWVISFGKVAKDTETRLTKCATPGRYFNASNSKDLQDTFKSIADQISQLRLTK